MARGRLDPPNLDDRTWRELVDQARALIPRYAPEWTDHNPSDLGITLIELFAWLVEGMIYRLNRVPQKSQVEFLNLLGITRAPARPALTWLTYKLAAGGKEPVVVPKGTQVATPQTEQTAGVLFETDQDLRVLPINLAAALLIDGTTYRDITGDLVTKPLNGLVLDLAPKQTVTIALGLDQSSGEPLLFHVARALASGDSLVNAVWCYSHKADPPEEWIALPPTADETLALRQSGVVTLSVPAGQWGKQKPASWTNGPADGSKEYFWIGLRITSAAATKQQLGLTHILLNSVSATNALTIAQPELLGTSDGKPFQHFDLAHCPLWKRPGAVDPYDHLAIEVRPEGATTWVRWAAVPEIVAGPGSSFRLDPVTGTISFGDYDATRPDGHGSIPPVGSQVRASTYRYVDSGARGNVGPEAITVVRTVIAGATFKNPGPATGGLDEEAMEVTLSRAPELLRGSTRAVTVDDYEQMALAAAPAVAKVRCLPPLPADQVKAYGGLTRHVGHVNLIVVPRADLGNRQPQPSAELIWQIQAYLARRRTLTVQLDVVGPRYLPIIIEVVIRVWPQLVPQDTAAATAWKEAIRQDTLAKTVAFLHPLWGGREQQGWEIGQDFLIADLLQSIRPDSSIGYIEKVTAKAGQATYERPQGMVGETPGVWVQIADFELLCSAAVQQHQVRVLKVGEPA